MNNIETNLSAFLSDSISNDSNSESIIIFSSSENAGHPVIVHLGISYSGNKYPLSYASYVSVDDVYSIIQHPFSFHITQLDSNGNPITTTYYLNQNGILNIQDVIITKLSLKGTCPEPNKLRIQYEWKSQDLESGNPKPGDPSNPNNPNNPSNPTSPKERARELGPPSHYDGDTLQFIYRYEIIPEDLETYGFASIMSGRIYGKLTNNIFTPDDFEGYFLAVFNQNVESDDIADYWAWTFIPPTQ